MGRRLPEAQQSRWPIHQVKELGQLWQVQVASGQPWDKDQLLLWLRQAGCLTREDPPGLDLSLTRALSAVGPGSGWRPVWRCVLG